MYSYILCLNFITSDEVDFKNKSNDNDVGRKRAAETQYIRWELVFVMTRSFASL